VGKCYVFRGGDTLGTSPAAVLFSGATHNENFGTAVASASSYGAFPPFILAGAEGNDDAGTDAGKMYAFKGPDPTAGDPDDQVVGSEPSSSFGHSVDLIYRFVASHTGLLALGGAYEEGTSGRARLFSIDLSDISLASAGPSINLLAGNPYLSGNSIEFGGVHDIVDAKLTIVDVKGRIVFSSPVPQSGHLVWDGRTPQGRLAAPGAYFYFLYPSCKSGKIILLK
jgi:hypothetical protein